VDGHEKVLHSTVTILLSFDVENTVLGILCQLPQRSVLVLIC